MLWECTPVIFMETRLHKFRPNQGASRGTFRVKTVNWLTKQRPYGSPPLQPLVSLRLAGYRSAQSLTRGFLSNGSLPNQTAGFLKSLACRARHACRQHSMAKASKGWIGDGKEMQERHANGTCRRPLMEKFCSAMRGATAFQIPDSGRSG
ncbi:hypothetical protein LZ30DRAFT_28439 [Colletotrichum cereale]|nr:hypothetical protein LZ30DRAFT_28439 [Colletotrichum cereale]